MDTLRNRIDLVNIPFTERGSRLMLFRQGHRLFIRLAERWVKWENEVGHYRKRPPIVMNFTFLDAQGQPIQSLDCESYPHVVHLRNLLGQFDVCFLDAETLLVRLPAGRYGLEFSVQSERGQTDRRGGTLHGKRNFAYTTNARLLSNKLEQTGPYEFFVRLQMEAQEGQALLLNVTPRLAYNRAIPDPQQALSQAEASWRVWFAAVPPVLEQYRAQYDYAWWIMRSGLVNTRYYFTREALLPSKIHYVGVWHWDQVFHALAHRYAETRLAEDQLRIILDHQRADGMLPDAIHDEGLVDHLKLPVDADVTKPPIMAWGALKLYETSARIDFLQEVYEPLTRWHAWWIEVNRSEEGLCVYRHPFSSGLDDNPMWDAGMPVAAPDLNTYLVIQCESLARMAALVGDAERVERFQRRGRELLEAMLRHMWDEDAGVFWALHEGQPIRTLTPFNLLPLITGQLPQAINERLIAHLTNPETFWTPYPIPTVAASDPSFDPWQMWRGPVWINLNYFFVEGLERVGQAALAAELRRKTLDMVQQQPDIYEYYHPISGERPPKAAPMFGWSAALFIELALAETRAAQQV